MMKYFKVLFLSTLATVSVSCSSAGKITYYKFEQLQKPEIPKVGYIQTHVMDPNLASVRGYTLKYIYREKYRVRFLQLSHFQYAELSFKDYGYKNYSWGPIFLPVIPNFNFSEEKELDMNAPLEFTLSFYSDPVFKNVSCILPDLEIVTNAGKILKPTITKSLYGSGNSYKFDVKVKDLPWFILREANITISNGQHLQMPETKFTLKSEFEIDWSVPIGP